MAESSLAGPSGVGEVAVRIVNAQSAGATRLSRHAEPAPILSPGGRRRLRLLVCGTNTTART